MDSTISFHERVAEIATQRRQLLTEGIEFLPYDPLMATNFFLNGYEDSNTRVRNLAMERVALTGGNLERQIQEIELEIALINGREFKKAMTKQDEEIEGVLRNKVSIVEDADVCAVCLEELKVGDDARAIECSHTFHSSCISEWAKRKLNCPLCRHDMRIKSVKQRRLNN